jgi:hypothetical protein
MHTFGCSSITSTFVGYKLTQVFYLRCPFVNHARDNPLGHYWYMSWLDTRQGVGS